MSRRQRVVLWDFAGPCVTVRYVLSQSSISTKPEIEAHPRRRLSYTTDCSQDFRPFAVTQWCFACSYNPTEPA